MKRVSNAQLMTEVEYIKKKVDDMHLVIHGNGDPRRGVTSRVTVLETVCQRMEKLAWLIAGAVISAIVVAVFALIRTVG